MSYVTAAIFRKILKGNKSILKYTKILLGEVLCTLNAITIVMLLIDILPTRKKHGKL